MNNKNWKRESTMYEGLFKYIAPDGYVFWSNDSCYGSVIWGGDKLSNYYVLKKKTDK